MAAENTDMWDIPIKRMILRITGGHVDANFVRQMASEHGKVRKVKFMRNKEAFVYFTDVGHAQQATKAMDGMKKNGLSFEARLPQPTRSLWVGKVKDKEQLMRDFEKFGTLTEVEVVPNLKCSFVTFETVEAATAALKSEQGKIEDGVPTNLDFHDRRPMDRREDERNRRAEGRDREDNREGRRGDDRGAGGERGDARGPRGGRNIADDNYGRGQQDRQDRGPRRGREGQLEGRAGSFERTREDREAIRDGNRNLARGNVRVVRPRGDGPLRGEDVHDERGFQKRDRGARGDEGRGRYNDSSRGQDFVSSRDEGYGQDRRIVVNGRDRGNQAMIVDDDEGRRRGVGRTYERAFTDGRVQVVQHVQQREIPGRAYEDRRGDARAGDRFPQERGMGMDRGRVRQRDNSGSMAGRRDGRVRRPSDGVVGDVEAERGSAVEMDQFDGRKAVLNDSLSESQLAERAKNFEDLDSFLDRMEGEPEDNEMQGEDGESSLRESRKRRRSTSLEESSPKRRATDAAAAREEDRQVESSEPTSVPESVEKTGERKFHTLLSSSSYLPN